MRLAFEGTAHGHRLCQLVASAVEHSEAGQGDRECMREDYGGSWRPPDQVILEVGEGGSHVATEEECSSRGNCKGRGPEVVFGVVNKE